MSTFPTGVDDTDVVPPTTQADDVVTDELADAATQEERLLQEQFNANSQAAREKANALRSQQGDAAPTDDDTARALNEAGGDGAHEASIPYEKWKADKERYEREATEARQQADTERQARETLQKAFAAGYPTVEAYDQANRGAIASGFESIEIFNELSRFNRGLQDRVDAGELADDLRQRMVVDQHDRLRLLDKIKATEARLDKFEQGTVESAFADARSTHFKGLPDTAWQKFETRARAQGATPEAIRDGAALFGELLKEANGTAKQDAVIEYNSRTKAANGNGTVPPEGRGGGGAPPPANSAPANADSGKAARNTLLSDLLGMRKGW